MPLAPPPLSNRILKSPPPPSYPTPLTTPTAATHPLHPQPPTTRPTLRSPTRMTIPIHTTTKRTLLTPDLITLSRPCLTSQLLQTAPILSTIQAYQPITLPKRHLLLPDPPRPCLLGTLNSDVGAHQTNLAITTAIAYPRPIQTTARTLSTRRPRAQIVFLDRVQFLSAHRY